MRRLEAFEHLEEPAAASPQRYPAHVLRHGLTRVRATLAWIDETSAAIEAERRAARAQAASSKATRSS